MPDMTNLPNEQQEAQYDEIWRDVTRLTHAQMIFCQQRCLQLVNTDRNSIDDCPASRDEAQLFTRLVEAYIDLAQLPYSPSEGWDDDSGER